MTGWQNLDRSRELPVCVEFHIVNVSKNAAHQVEKDPKLLGVAGDKKSLKGHHASRTRRSFQYEYALHGLTSE